MTAGDPMIAGRINHVQDLCDSAIKFDLGKAGGGLTDRAWLAQSVINILNGLIDVQITEEINRAAVVAVEGPP